MNKAILKQKILTGPLNHVTKNYSDVLNCDDCDFHDGHDGSVRSARDDRIAPNPIILKS